eukprot:2400-Heterococcus_DN1.PRE.6
MSYDASEEQELLEQVDDDEQQQSGSEKRDSTAGALVRAITRQGKVLSRLMARADIGALPRRLPTQRVASLSDTFAKGVDVWTSYTEGRQKAESAAAADSKLRRALRAGVHAVPSFARSAVLGTALFAAYETTFDAMASAAQTSTLPLEQAQSSVLQAAAASDQQQQQQQPYQQLLLKAVQLPPAVWSGAQALSAGAVAGSLHGVLTVSADSAIARQLVPHIPGTVLSHTLVHASLFGTYEFSKVRNNTAGNSLCHYQKKSSSSMHQFHKLSDSELMQCNVQAALQHMLTLHVCTAVHTRTMSAVWLLGTLRTDHSQWTGAAGIAAAGGIAGSIQITSAGPSATP